MVRRRFFSLTERPVLADGSHICLGEAPNTEVMSTALTDTFTLRLWVSDHRVPTAEIEAALLEHSAVAEATALGIHDQLSGLAVNANQEQGWKLYRRRAQKRLYHASQQVHQPLCCTIGCPL